MVHESFDDLTDGALDGALRAAYGAHGDAGHAEGPPADDGVLATLHETVGVRPRVLLRDEAEDTPVIRPLSGGSGSADVQRCGRYQVLGELARGGVGVVLKGRDADLGRDVAVKVLRGEHGDNASMVQRFVEEAQIAGQLQHPGVLPVYELGLDAEHRPFFTMKLIKGHTLAAELKNRARVVAERVHFLGVFEQVCQAMAYAHSRGVIHRDLKPSNIMVGAFGEMQIVDWGLAKVLAHGGLADESVVRDDSMVRAPDRTGTASESVVGSVMGTPAYMPPEQARGAVDQLDKTSDVFSLGAILLEILIGRPPYSGDREQVLEQAKAGALDPVLEALQASDVDDDLAALTRQCLAIERDQRPTDAGVVARRVADYLSSLERRARDHEIAAARAAARAIEERKARRLTLLLAGVVILALAGAWLGWSYAAEQRQKTAAARRVESEQRMVERRVALEEALARAARFRGAAEAAPASDRKPRLKTLDAAAHAEALLERGGLDVDTVARARASLDELHQAMRERQVVEDLEDIVIVNATHSDRQSWTRMEARLRAAFATLGIDVLDDDIEAVAEGLRSKAFPAQLTKGYELWVATCGTLMGMGSEEYTRAGLNERLEALYLADRDPFRTHIRRIIWDPNRDVGQIALAPDKHAALCLDVDMDAFDAALPVTLSWMAMSCTVRPDGTMDTSLYERAALLHPDDFMLNWDYALMLGYMGEWDKATRYYNRCVAIRPDVAGAWRSLGVAYRHLGIPKEAVQALQRAVALQPDHASTQIDLGLAEIEAGQHAEGMDRCRELVDVGVEDASVHCCLGRGLMLTGDPAAALVAFERCSTMDARGGMSTEPIQAWIEACRAELE